MASQTQGPGDYFLWKAPGKSLSIVIHLDVIDRLSADVQRAFIAIPKRGAEAGGILLGTIEHGDTSIVRIDDYEPIESEYKNGPSYLLSDADRAQFRTACEHWQPDESRSFYAVGYYRSHTRDGLALAPEDVALLDEFFPSPQHIALLIKPHAAQVSTAGFFFREDGLFSAVSPQEFSFRRRELSAGEAPPPSPPRDLQPPRRPPPPFQRTPTGLRTAVWIPLSFVFLLFGVALGLLIALSRLTPPAPTVPNFSLGLVVSPSDDNLSIRWDHDSTAIRAASRGVLEIEDGTYTKSVDLDTAQLKNGSITYRSSSSAVRLRLAVFPETNVTVTQTVDWRR